MVSCTLRGGVGNQMFQIATAYTLALKNNDECAFDMDRRKTYGGVVYQGREASLYFNSLYKKVRQLPDGWKPEHKYSELKDFVYSPIPYKKNLLLYGYFQSEKYFEGHGQEIVKLFVDDELLSGIRKKYEDMLPDSIAVHVRRGDFAKFHPVHVLLGMDYYTEALNYIQRRRDVNKILVFSDSMSWCRDNFKNDNFVFIEGTEDWEDMYLMSLCTHNIIANSSFSWWGAYFNSNKDGIVIAPHAWMNLGDSYDYKDVYCENWIII